jgi:hypothetical protein
MVNPGEFEGYIFIESWLAEERNGFKIRCNKNNFNMATKVSKKIP